MLKETTLVWAYQAEKKNVKALVEFIWRVITDVQIATCCCCLWWERPWCIMGVLDYVFHWQLKLQIPLTVCSLFGTGRDECANCNLISFISTLALENMKYVVNYRWDLYVLATGVAPTPPTHKENKIQSPFHLKTTFSSSQWAGIKIGLLLNLLLD